MGRDYNCFVVFPFFPLLKTFIFLGNALGLVQIRAGSLHSLISVGSGLHGLLKCLFFLLFVLVTPFQSCVASAFGVWAQSGMSLNMYKH